MIVVQQIERVVTPEQVQAFAEGNDSRDLGGGGCRSAREFIVWAFRRFGHCGLHKSRKGLVRRCLAKVKGLVWARLTRLRRQYLDTERIPDRRAASGTGVPEALGRERHAPSGGRERAVGTGVERMSSVVRTVLSCFLSWRSNIQILRGIDDVLNLAIKVIPNLGIKGVLKFRIEGIPHSSHRVDEPVQSLGPAGLTLNNSDIIRKVE